MIFVAVALLFTSLTVSIYLLALCQAASLKAPLSAPGGSGPRITAAATYSNNVEGTSAALDDCSNHSTARRAG